MLSWAPRSFAVEISRLLPRPEGHWHSLHGKQLRYYSFKKCITRLRTIWESHLSLSDAKSNTPEILKSRRVASLGLHVLSTQRISYVAYDKGR